MTFRTYIDSLTSIGKYFFTESDALLKTGLSKIALRSALRRLKKKQEIASPLRGFYIIVPSEYRSLGCLPPEQFIDDLMRHLKIPYYVGLLSAAQYYGAAHQKPQVFQVVVGTARRNIQIGRVKIEFTTKSNAEQTMIRQFNTPKGFVRVAAPEAIALDILAFPHSSGGIGGAFNIFSELSEQFKIEEFAKAIPHVKKIPVVQRLGYLFDRLGMGNFAKLCEKELKSHRFVRKTALSPQENPEGAVNKRWNLIINIDLEEELDT